MLPVVDLALRSADGRDEDPFDRARLEAAMRRYHRRWFSGEAPPADEAADERDASDSS